MSNGLPGQGSKPYPAPASTSSHSQPAAGNTHTPPFSQLLTGQQPRDARPQQDATGTTHLARMPIRSRPKPVIKPPSLRQLTLPAQPESGKPLPMQVPLIQNPQKSMPEANRVLFEEFVLSHMPSVRDSDRSDARGRLLWITQETSDPIDALNRYVSWLETHNRRPSYQAYANALRPQLQAASLLRLAAIHGMEAEHLNQFEPTLKALARDPVLALSNLDADADAVAMLNESMSTLLAYNSDLDRAPGALVRLRQDLLDKVLATLGPVLTGLYPGLSGITGALDQRRLDAEHSAPRSHEIPNPAGNPDGANGDWPPADIELLVTATPYRTNDEQSSERRLAKEVIKRILQNTVPGKSSDEVIIEFLTEHPELKQFYKDRLSGITPSLPQGAGAGTGTGATAKTLTQGQIAIDSISAVDLAKILNETPPEDIQRLHKDNPEFYAKILIKLAEAYNPPIIGIKNPDQPLPEQQAASIRSALEHLLKAPLSPPPASSRKRLRVPLTAEVKQWLNTQRDSYRLFEIRTTLSDIAGPDSNTGWTVTLKEMQEMLMATGSRDSKILNVSEDFPVLTKIREAQKFLKSMGINILFNEKNMTPHSNKDIIFIVNALGPAIKRINMLWPGFFKNMKFSQAAFFANSEDKLNEDLELKNNDTLSFKTGVKEKHKKNPSGLQNQLLSELANKFIPSQLKLQNRAVDFLKETSLAKKINELTTDEIKTLREKSPRQVADFLIRLTDAHRPSPITHLRVRAPLGDKQASSILSAIERLLGSPLPAYSRTANPTKVADSIAQLSDNELLLLRTNFPDMTIEIKEKLGQSIGLASSRSNEDKILLNEALSRLQTPLSTTVDNDPRLASAPLTKKIQLATKEKIKGSEVIGFRLTINLLLGREANTGWNLNYHELKQFLYDVASSKGAFNKNEKTEYPTLKNASEAEKLLKTINIDLVQQDGVTAKENHYYRHLTRTVSKLTPALRRLHEWIPDILKGLSLSKTPLKKTSEDQSFLEINDDVISFMPTPTLDWDTIRNYTTFNVNIETLLLNAIAENYLTKKANQQTQKSEPVTKP